MPSLHKIAVSALAAFAIALTSHSVEAHGKLLKPEAKIRQGSGVSDGKQYDFVGEIKGNDVFKPARGESWSGNPQKNAQLFATYFQANGHKTLRQFFQTIENNMKPRFPGKTDNVCGFTGGDAAVPATLPSDGVLEWGNLDGRWGFQDNHYGPCEVWCDDKLVLQNMDCRAAFGKELPARMKIDAAQCSGAKRLQFLWLAVHFANWQYWLNCVPLAGSVEAPAVANATVSAPSAVPALVPAMAPVVAPAPVPAAVPGVGPTDNNNYNYKQQAPVAASPVTANANDGKQNDWRSKFDAWRAKFGGGNWPGAGTVSNGAGSPAGVSAGAAPAAANPTPALAPATAATVPAAAAVPAQPLAPVAAPATVDNKNLYAQYV